MLDLDHTLLDFSSKQLTENGTTAMQIGSSDDAVANKLKRPYMDEFLAWTYKYYDLVVWSQTSWRWLEVCFVSCLIMFTYERPLICYLNSGQTYRARNDYKPQLQDMLCVG